MCKGRYKLEYWNMLKFIGILILCFGTALGSCSKSKNSLKQDTKETVVTDGKGFSEILGRPTNSSVTMSILFDQPSDVYWEYGTSSGSYPLTTGKYLTVKATPMEIDFTNLSANTKYYYRTRYKLAGASSIFDAGPERSFQTQRLPGSTYTFTVESDEHLYDKKGVQSIYQICLNNQALDKPDFMFSLGDTFGDDHQATTITSSELDVLHQFYRPFLGTICHSVPLFVCPGNHEGENDYYIASVF